MAEDNKKLESLIERLNEKLDKDNRLNLLQRRKDAAEARNDRIYVSAMPSFLSQLNVIADVMEEPVKNWKLGISDHSLFFRHDVAQTAPPARAGRGFIAASISCPVSNQHWTSC